MVRAGGWLRERGLEVGGLEVRVCAMRWAVADAVAAEVERARGDAAKRPGAGPWL